MIARSMTAEEFAEQRYELSEDGPWSELICGEAVALHPPDTKHGTVVLNLSKTLADWIESSRIGYACFELGLILGRNPDTVCCPPISYFIAGNRWEELDKTVTASCPALVVEISSTPDRSRLLPGRIPQYLKMGVSVVWVVDPAQRSITVHTAEADAIAFAHDATLSSGAGWAKDGDGGPILSGFSLPVGHAFREPDWWSGGSGSNA